MTDKTVGSFNGRTTAEKEGNVGSSPIPTTTECWVHWLKNTYEVFAKYLLGKI